MSTLLQTQQAFLDYLLEKSTHFEDDIVGTARFNKKTRLGIYSDAYASRLVEALQDNYPALHTLIGRLSIYAHGTTLFSSTSFPKIFSALFWRSIKPILIPRTSL